jgi:predicted outer membrane repeat protein
MRSGTPLLRIAASMALAWIFTASLASAQFVWHVDATAPPGGSGLTWGDPLPDIHAAFAAAVPGDTIRIAQGTYAPDTGHPTLPPASRAAYWTYAENVTVEGGYRGLAPGGAPDDRDTDLFATILSGEIGDPGLIADNSQTLIRANVAGDIILDGLTLTHAYQDDPSTLVQGHYGSALWTFGSNSIQLHDLRVIDNETVNGSLVGQGGAVFIFGTPGTISDCEFSGNRIGGTQFQTVAAGVFIWESDIVFTDCIFEDNVSDGSGGAAYAGGIYIEHGYPVFERCGFRDNFAGSGGGAVFHRDAWDPVNQPNREGAPLFIDCVFEDNLANQGGAAFIWSRRPQDHAQFQNCVFLDNKSVQNGAAIYSNGGGTTVMSVTIDGCLFAGNEVGFGSGSFTQNGAAFDGPGAQASIIHSTLANNLTGRAVLFSSFPSGSYLIANSIIRNNGTGSLNTSSTSGSIVSSNVQGASGLPAAIAQTGVVDVDPLFLNVPVRDYRLAPASPMIDFGAAGQTMLATDLSGGPREVDGDGDCLAAVDAGAYEAPDLCLASAGLRRGDVNIDGMTNIADAVYLLGNLFPGPGGSNTISCLDSADGNDDGLLNIADAIAILAALFGTPALPLPPPTGACGADATADSFDCASYPNCP